MKTSTLMTNSRCISHSQNTKPKDFSSTTLSSYQTPQETREYENSKVPVGPKAKLLATQMKAFIDEEFIRKNEQELDEKRKMVFNSTNSDTYKVDGFTPTLKTDVAEYPGDNQPANDTPITFFSDTIARSDKLSFPVTSVNPAKPFRRQNQFSEQYSNRAWWDQLHWILCETMAHWYYYCVHIRGVCCEVNF